MQAPEQPKANSGIYAWRDVLGWFTATADHVVCCGVGFVHDVTACSVAASLLRSTIQLFRTAASRRWIPNGRYNGCIDTVVYFPSSQQLCAVFICSSFMRPGTHMFVQSPSTKNRSLFLRQYLCDSVRCRVASIANTPSSCCRCRVPPSQE